MIAAVAFDRDDNPSPVYRERFICTRDGAGDAQAFVDYYMGGLSSVSAAYNSLVIKRDACEVTTVAAVHKECAQKSPMERKSAKCEVVRFESR